MVAAAPRGRAAAGRGARRRAPGRRGCERPRGAPATGRIPAAAAGGAAPAVAGETSPRRGRQPPRSRAAAEAPGHRRRTGRPAAPGEPTARRSRARREIELRPGDVRQACADVRERCPTPSSRPYQSVTAGPWGGRARPRVAKRRRKEGDSARRESATHSARRRSPSGTTGSVGWAPAACGAAPGFEGPGPMGGGAGCWSRGVSVRPASGGCASPVLPGPSGSVWGDAAKRRTSFCQRSWSSGERLSGGW